MTRVLNILGSKAKHASKYPAPKYLLINEPFAGGAGYSLKWLEHQVTLYDIRPEVTRVWQYLIRATPEEILALPLIEPGQSVQELDCNEDARLLISWSLGVSDKPVDKLDRFNLWVWHNEPLNNRIGFWSPTRRASIARICTKIKHWKVEQLNWLDLLVHDRFNRKCTWFIDPPYQSQKFEDYYGTPPIDFGRLGDICRSLPGQVIVCEQEGADWLPFRPLHNILGANGTRSTEVIWTND